MGRLWLSLVVVVLVAACGEESSPDRAAAPTASGATPEDASDGGVDGPVIYASPQNGAEDALFRGVLTRDGDCLYIEYEYGSVSGRTALVWSNGTSWDATRSRVVGDGVDVAVGELISAGGGGRSPGELAVAGTTTDTDAIELATRCAEGGDGSIWFVQGSVRLGAPVTAPQPSVGGLDGPVIHVDLNQSAGGDRETGVVVLDADCLFIEFGGDDRAVLVWPDGARWEAAENEVVLGDATRIAVGDEIEAVGRFHPTLVTFATGEDVGLRADACASLGDADRIFVIEDGVEIVAP